jgi:ParB-like chromosome segregation protein Spo0J
MIKDSIRQRGFQMHIRLIAKIGPINKEGESTFLIIDGMHRVTAMQELFAENGDIKYQYVPISVYREDLPLRLMVAYAAGNYSP